MWDPYAEFEEATLFNGLKVYALHWPDRPWESLAFVIHTGGASDPTGMEGIGHFVEHLVSANASVPVRTLVRFFEESGGGIGLGATGYRNTNYTALLPADERLLSEAFNLVGSMLITAQLRRRVEHERQVIVQEYFRSHPNKVEVEWRQRERTSVFGGTFLERLPEPIIGSPETVRKIKCVDLQKHYDTHYSPANISVVGIGGVSVQTLVKLLEESPFGTSKPGKRTLLPVPVHSGLPPTERLFESRMSEHSKIPMNVGAYKSIAQLPGTVNNRAVEIVVDMIQDALDEEIREKRRWSYSVTTERQDYGGFWRFAIQGPVDPDALNSIDEVMSGIIASLAKRKSLFEKEKQHRIRRMRLWDFSRGDIRSDVIADLTRFQRIVPVAEILEGCKAVTFADVRAVLESLRDEQRWTHLIRP